jgi:hypothetical protein
MALGYALWVLVVKPDADRLADSRRLAYHPAESREGPRHKVESDAFGAVGLVEPVLSIGGSCGWKVRAGNGLLPVGRPVVVFLVLGKIAETEVEGAFPIIVKIIFEINGLNARLTSAA